MNGPTMRDYHEGRARCTVKSPRSTDGGTMTCATASAWRALPASGSWPRKKLMMTSSTDVAAASSVGCRYQHCAIRDRRLAPLPDMVKQHAGCHCDHKEDHGRRQCRQVLKSGARAQADETPADPEHCCPDDQRPIDIGLGRPCNLQRQDRPLTAPDQRESGHANCQRRHHDDRETWVPGTKDIEKA